MPKEIQEDELLGWVKAILGGPDNVADLVQGDLATDNFEQGDQQHQHFNQNLQLGFV